MATDILVVEDDADGRHVLAEILEEEGYHVATAADGKAALARCDCQAPALVILDLKLPILDGVGFAAELRRRGVSVVVLVLSAASDAEEQAAAIGAAGCIAKPFELDALLREVALLTRGGGPGALV
jgi:DNA-binding response OmpR family regulator